MVDSPRASDDSVAVMDVRSPTKDGSSPADANDTRALISSSPHSSPVSVSVPLDHSSPKQLWDWPSPSQAQSTTCLAQSISRDSMCSRRRASSVHDIEGLSTNSKRLSVNVSASWPAVKEVDDSPSKGHKSSLQKLTRSLRSFGLSRLSDQHIAFSDLPGRVRACKRKRYIIQHFLRRERERKKSTMATDHCCCRHNF